MNYVTLLGVEEGRGSKDALPSLLFGKARKSVTTGKCSLEVVRLA